MTIDGLVGTMKVAQRRRQGHAVHHLLFAEGRQPADVVQAAYVGRHQPSATPETLVKRDLPGACHQLQKAAILQRPELLATDACQPLREGVAERVVGQDLSDIEGLVVGQVSH